MSRYDRVERTFPWIIVAVFLAGALLIAAGIIAGSLVLGLAGTALVVVATVGGFVLPRYGLSAPLSFSADFPERHAGQSASRFSFRQNGQAERTPNDGSATRPTVTKEGGDRETNQRTRPGERRHV